MRTINARVLLGAALLSTLAAAGIQRGHRLYQLRVANERLREVLAKLPPTVPATVFFKETLTAPGKPELLSTERTYAVREDGSVVRIDKQYTNAGFQYLTHWEMELADGTRAEGDEQTKTMTALKLAPGSLGSALDRWDPATNCTVQVNQVNRTARPTAHERIAGIETVRIVSSDSATARITVWRAPGLNCLELRRLAEFKDPDGSVRDASDLVATEIRFGAPDNALFRVPDSYENISYSERFKRLEA